MIKILKNFLTNIGSVLRKPLTVNYPREKIIIPEGSRGMLHVKLDPDTLEVICEGCGQCSRICPKNCIQAIREKNQKGSTYLSELKFDAGGCIFCGNCIEACRQGAMEMSYRYQLAEYRRGDLLFEKLDLVRQADYTTRDFWSR
ncbi:MAG: 4Fe-4S dicluster domain-containing protein [Actinomycetota bacterium]